MKTVFKILAVGWLYSCGMNNSSENHQQIDTGFIIVEDKFDSVFLLLLLNLLQIVQLLAGKEKTKLKLN